MPRGDLAVLWKVSFAQIAAIRRRRGRTSQIDSERPRADVYRADRDRLRNGAKPLVTSRQPGGRSPAAPAGDLRSASQDMVRPHLLCHNAMQTGHGKVCADWVDRERPAWPAEHDNWSYRFRSTLREKTASSSCGRMATAHFTEDGAHTVTAAAAPCWLSCPPESARCSPALNASPMNLN